MIVTGVVGVVGSGRPSVEGAGTVDQAAVNRRSLPYPFIHEWVRSTGQRLPTWIEAGKNLRQIADLGRVVATVQVHARPVRAGSDHVADRGQGRLQQGRVVIVGPRRDQVQRVPPPSRRGRWSTSQWPLS